MTLRALVLIAAVTACGGSEGPFTIVTIQTQPAVHDVGEIVVTLTNDGTSLERRFDVNNPTFPATFSISAPGRTGELEVRVDANDRDGLLVGRGSTTTLVDSPTATVLLDSADFVVNTDFADDQFPSDDFESNGFQISAAPDGTWTVVYRDRCTNPCNMFARRFDVDGHAVDSAIAAGTNGFPISTDLTLGLATPAVASDSNATIAVWDFSEPSPSTTDGVACRAMDPSGNPTGDQVPVSIEQIPDVVSVTALENQTFAVSWNGFVSPDNVIKAAIVDSQCAPSNVVQVSTVLGTSGANRGAVATTNDRILYAWIVDGSVRGRIMDLTNQPLSADIPIVSRNATEKIEFVRVAPLGTGFAIVVRWGLDGVFMGPGRIELYRTDNGGGLMGGPTVVTTRSGSDFDSRESFGVAHRSDDDALLVVWHSCGENGDGSGCGVFGRVLRSTGVPVGDEFTLATTTELDQKNPAAVGLPGAFATTWMDLSQQSPDKSGAAARARVIYPPFDDAKAILGAVCASDAECGAGLACGASSDGGKRCFVTCDAEGPPPQCPGGGTCSITIGGNSACQF